MVGVAVIIIFSDFSVVVETGHGFLVESVFGKHNYRHDLSCVIADFTAFWSASLTGRLALFTDDAGWHGKQLRLAFAQHGYEAEFVSLTECYFDIQANQPVIKIPGFEQKLPCV